VSTLNSIIDALFIVLFVVCFGTIIWHNITETSKAKKQLRKHELTKRQQCK
jgi:hypothetical protein